MKKIFTLLSISLLLAGAASAQTTPSATITTTPATKCTPPCDGTASVSASVSIGTAQYTWDTNPVQTTQTATGLCPGVYTCTVTVPGFGSASGTGTVTCSATGVNELEVDDNVSVFPNPAHQELNLISEEPMKGNVSVEIRNIMGLLVYLENVEVNGQLTRKINVSDLPVGIYDVEIINGTKITRKKFMKD